MPRRARVRCLLVVLLSVATGTGAGVTAAAATPATADWPLVPGGPLDAARLPGATGRGVLVAVVDSGVDLDHPDLRGAIDGRGIDLLEPGTPPQDEGGHGTAIAGIVAGRGQGAGRRGLAPAATVLPVRVLDATGHGATRDVVAGIDYAVDAGARVVVLSLGTATPDDTLTAALRRARDRSVLVVAAAGNTGSAPLFPAAQREDGVLAVAATGHDGRVIDASARGILVPLGAPGDGVPTLAPGGGTIRMTGTSFAAPWVAAAAADLMSAWPAADTTTVRRALMTSATRDVRPAGALSSGTLDVRRAWRSVRRALRARSFIR